MRLTVRACESMTALMMACVIQCFNSWTRHVFGGKTETHLMVNEAFQVPANYSGKKTSNHFVGEKKRAKCPCTVCVALAGGKNEQEKWRPSVKEREKNKCRGERLAAVCRTNLSDVG